MEDDLWRSDDVVSKETKSARFSDFPIRDEILRSLSALKIFRPSPVQLKSLPHGLSGKSLLVQSKSGTGKTLVFAIIALNHLDTSQQPQQDPEAPKTTKSKKKTRQTKLRQAASDLQGVVVSPTREIALQIADEIIRLGWYISPRINCICCVGGVPHNQEIARLVKTKCHMLVATPGRLAFVLRSGYRIRGKKFRSFALDEADRLLDSQFRHRVTQLIKKCVDWRVQFVAASATFSPSQVEYIEELLANVDDASYDNRAKCYYGEDGDEQDEKKEIGSDSGKEEYDANSVKEIQEILAIEGEANEEGECIEESRSEGDINEKKENVELVDLGVEVCRHSVSMNISQTEDDKMVANEAISKTPKIVFRPREIVKVFLCSSFNMDRLATASNIEVVEVATLRALKFFAHLKGNSLDDIDSFRLRANACFEVLFTVPFRQALIFCNDRESGENIVEALNGVGVSSVYTSGSLSQSQRMKSLQAIKSLQSRILICSDVISRGVDLLSVDLVINFDLPLDRDTFLHRSGRAGRFGRPGICVCLGHFSDTMSIQYFALQLGITISDFDMNATESFAVNSKGGYHPDHLCDEEQIEIKFNSTAERQNLPIARGDDMDMGSVVKKSEICLKGFAQVEDAKRSLLLESLEIKSLEDNLVDRLPKLLKDMVEFLFCHSKPKLEETDYVPISGIRDCNGVMKDFMANHASIWNSPPIDAHYAIIA